MWRDRANQGGRSAPTASGGLGSDAALIPVPRISHPSRSVPGCSQGNCTALRNPGCSEISRFLSSLSLCRCTTIPHFRIPLGRTTSLQLRTLIVYGVDYDVLCLKDPMLGELALEGGLRYSERKINPRVTARRTRPATSWMSSLDIRCALCFSTVFTLIERRLEISLLVCPSATS